MTHVITIQPPFDGTCIFLCCSCSDEPIAKVGFPEAPASLVEINEIAHRHIEVSERYDQLRDVTVNWPGTTIVTEEIRVAAFEPISRPASEPLRPAFDDEHAYYDGRSGTIG